MRKALQCDLLAGNYEHGPNRFTHGGDLNKGKRKLKRPFKKNTPIHVVLKASQARGKNSMRSAHNRIAIDRIVEKQARKQNAKIHSQQNVGNHFHLLVSFKTREQLIKFLKAITGLIARHVLKVRKGKPANGKFFDEIPFTRITHGLRDFYGMLRYIAKNTIEAEKGKEWREGIENFDRAQAKAAKTGRPITDFL